MNDREMLLKRVQMFDFVLDELNLFLDTHPHNKKALSYFTQYQYLKNQAENQFEQKYGPLSAENFTGGEYFDWVKGPWPWESEGKCNVDLR